MTFENKVILITGGSSGIGAACSEHFRRLGARISIVDTVEPSVSKDILVTTGDIRSPSVRSHAVEVTLDTYGAIDILVNNVGLGLYEAASRSEADGELHIFETNVFSAIALSGIVIPHMKSRRQGWIANISSVGAYVGLPWSATYCASKAALQSYAESLRRELRAYGIHVSTIVPGIVDTQFREHVLGGQAPPQVLNIRRIVSPQKVASCVVRSIARRQLRIFIPWYGRIFTAIDFFFPRLMDSYIARQWSVENLARSERALRYSAADSRSAEHADVSRNSSGNLG